MTPLAQRLTAMHEAGHAAVGLYLGGIIKLVSIKPSSSCDGYCRFDMSATLANAPNGAPVPLWFWEHAVIYSLAGKQAEMASGYYRQSFNGDASDMRHAVKVIRDHLRYKGTSEDGDEYEGVLSWKNGVPHCRKKSIPKAEVLPHLDRLRARTRRIIRKPEVQGLINGIAEAIVNGEENNGTIDSENSGERMTRPTDRLKRHSVRVRYENLRRQAIKLWLIQVVKWYAIDTEILRRAA